MTDDAHHYDCNVFFFFQAEDGIRDIGVTGVQTCALPILIEAAAEELDLTRFGQLRAAGRAAARAGAWAAASDQLSAALLLWRGPPLADVPSRLLTETEVPRLAEMRPDALEARIDADLHP